MSEIEKTIELLALQTKSMLEALDRLKEQIKSAPASDIPKRRNLKALRKLEVENNLIKKSLKQNKVTEKTFKR